MSTLTSSSSVAPWGAGVGWWGGGSCHTIYIYNIIYMARACVAIEMCECVSTARVRGGGAGGEGGVTGASLVFRFLPRPSLPYPSLLSCLASYLVVTFPSITLDTVSIVEVTAFWHWSSSRVACFPAAPAAAAAPFFLFPYDLR